MDFAERLFEQILRADPLNADAWYHLGLSHRAAGRHEQAADALGRAVSCDPSNAEFLHSLGVLCCELNRIDEAVDNFQQAVQLAPEHAATHYQLGCALQQRGDPVGAKLRFQQAVRLQPDDCAAWNDLGIAHQALGELDQAGECFHKLCTLAPHVPAFSFNLGNIRIAQGKFLDSLACFTRALELHPRFVEALNNLGTALHRLGQTNRALQAYTAALQIEPRFPDARNNVGALLNELGRPLEAETCYRQTLEADPNSVPALVNLAGMLQSQLRLDESEPLLRRALALEPENADALGNLGNVLSLQGRTADAAESYRRAVEICSTPRLRIHAATNLPPVYDSLDDLRRRRDALESAVALLAREPVGLDPSRQPIPVNFLTAYQGLNDRGLALQFARLYRAESLPAVGASTAPSTNPGALPAPHFAASTAPRATAAIEPGPAAAHSAIVGRRIRVGFVSRFLRDHTIGDLTRGLIRQLPRRDFEVTVFALGSAVDPTVSFLRESTDYVTLPEEVIAARSIIREARVDVLIYPDVGMDPLTSALAFTRLAPVQCAMWGHPVTTGSPAIDYFLSSKLIEPEGAAGHYTEQLVQFDSLPAYYYRPAGGSVSPNGISSAVREAARREFGLSAKAHLHLCPQSLFKFHPEFDPLLAGILSRDPAARLVLIAAPHVHWTEALSRRLQGSLRGIFERVVFVPRVGREAFLRLLTAADVILDPLHFGGGNTSYQALGLGLPIVMLPGEFMRGRVTAGCYRKMGVRTCIAASRDDYINLAHRLGTDPAFNASVRAEIVSYSAALFEDLAAVHELETFLASAVGAARSPANRPLRPAAA
jgi:protein O-GlcNAc transferase